MYNLELPVIKVKIIQVFISLSWICDDIKIAELLQKVSRRVDPDRLGLSQPCNRRSVVWPEYCNVAQRAKRGSALEFRVKRCFGLYCQNKGKEGCRGFTWESTYHTFPIHIKLMHEAHFRKNDLIRSVKHKSESDVPPSANPKTEAFSP